MSIYHICCCCICKSKVLLIHVWSRIILSLATKFLWRIIIFIITLQLVIEIRNYITLHTNSIRSPFVILSSSQNKAVCSLNSWYSPKQSSLFTEFLTQPKSKQSVHSILDTAQIKAVCSLKSWYSPTQSSLFTQFLIQPKSK